MEARLEKEKEDRERLCVNPVQLQQQRDTELLREREDTHGRRTSHVIKIAKQQVELNKLKEVDGLQADLAIAKVKGKLALAREKVAKLLARNVRNARRRPKTQHSKKIVNSP